MNIMRKLLVSGGSGRAGTSNSNANAVGNSSPTDGGATPENTTPPASGIGSTPIPSSNASSHQLYSTTALGLMHLHKLFAELIHPTEPLTQQEQEQRLYNMLPLFCKVFGNSPAADLVGKFCDILSFCQMVSRLMVSEIRRRASNQSTEAASCAIAKFLEIESTEEQSDGWMLLTTVNLLSAGGPPLIEVMTSSSLPSTLVKCLYLFFDLPEQKNVDVLESPQCQFTPKERRILLQKVFVQVLVRLCSNATPAEELARKDDLTLLFSAITSWCPAHNTVWRKSAAEVLMTLSRHGLTSHTVVNYIHSKGCVALCVENMQRVQELSPLEIVEMFVTIFCFLKDSSDISQILLDDFRTCQGYIFLSDFLLRLEQDNSVDACNALRNVVLLIASLTTCGYIELKPSVHVGTANSTLFQIPGFQMPQPSGRGASVRNIQAFQVLQSVFLKAQTMYLCNVVLDAISTVYHSDKANYFILEPQHTLSQLAEKIHLKQPQTQEKFFKLLEFIVFDINHVPCKELISLSILLKSQTSIPCSIICLRTLLNVLQFNNILKDVYREVGLLEVLATCLHRYAALLKEAFPEGPTSAAKVSIDEDQQTLGELTMEALTLLLSSNSSNAAVFRETGGARCAHNLVPYSVCRLSALSIVQQLVLNTGGDDDMGTLLGLMHTAPITALDLKSHILKSLFFVLRESHRTRTVFRKVGGFVYVMSVLVSMEGCLSSPPKSPWDTVDRKQLMALLRTVFNTLAMAMRFEPANARFFASEICHTSLTDTIRLLGCFTETAQLPSSDAFNPSNELVFHSIFTNGVYNESLIRSQNTESKDGTFYPPPDTLVYVCLVTRLLYDMALDTFDKQGTALSFVNVGNPQFGSVANQTLTEGENVSVSGGATSQNSSAFKGQRGLGSPHVGPLMLSPPIPEPVIVHPGVVMTMLHLIPSIECGDEPEMGKTLQLYITEVLRSLVRSERNQQVMCEAGLPSELLSLCTSALECESHPLHVPIQYILERLSAQALEPRDLRSFLRLSSPLCCLPFDEIGIDSVGGKFEIRPANQRDGGPVPLTRVKTLVSMTTPRDCRLHGTAITPPFVEFDMSSEGFSCLFLPSIAPQSATGPQVVGVGMVGMGPDTSSVIGGIGTGDRVFPPQPGLSFSTWFCVDRFSDNSIDPHPVRLLTLIRNLTSNKPGDEGSQLVCFSLQLSPVDKSILVSTQEIPFKYSSNLDLDAVDTSKDEVCVRIWSPDLLQESQWHHLVVVLNRAVLKNSSISVYLDSQHIKTQKLHYVSQNPGGGAANLTVASSVYGFIGTPPALRSTARLVWKQGPCHLLEEVLSPHSVALIYQLGPTYVGSLQAPPIPINNNKGGQSGPVSGVGVGTVVELAVAASSHQMSALVAEERVVFGLNASAVSVMTLARIRRVYTKTDCKAIAKMLGLSSHENATPIYILHNSAGHLGGPARSLGGVLIGYLGARVFVPRPVALTIQNVGGTAALLGLVAMAKDVEGLYAAVKALVCVAKSNVEAQHEMDSLHRYQTLAMLLKKKQDLLNSHILHLTFSLVGTVDSGRETTVIPNVQAFQDLLCNLEVWKEASGDLQKSLYEHFYELVTESCEQKANLQILRQVEMVPRLLQVLSNPSRLSQATIRILCNLLAALLQNTSRPQDILCFGQLTVATLPDPIEGVNERDIVLINPTQSSSSGYNLSNHASTPDTPKNVHGNSFSSREGISSVSSMTDVFSDGVQHLQSMIQLRNKCLQLLHALLFSINGSVNTQFCEEVVRVLGFDWFLLFAQPNLHPTTVKLSLQLLTVLLMHRNLMQKFKDASQNGGWLKDTDAVLRNSQHTNLLMGFNVGGATPANTNPSSKYGSATGSLEIHKDAYQVSGFQLLQYLLSYHTQITELYFLLLAVMLGQPAQHIPTSNKLTLDSLWSYLASGVAAASVSGNAGNSASSKGDGDDLCSEAAIVILAMIRAMLNPGSGRGLIPPEAPECPITLIQFLMFLYHNHPNFMLQCITQDFLTALVLTLFPMRQPKLSSSQDDSNASSLDEDFLMLPALSLDTGGGSNYNNGSSGQSTSVCGASSGPAQKVIMDFIRVVVVDSLTLPIQGAKQPPVIDIVLEACPTYASHWHKSSLHTDLLHSVLEHLKSADTMFLMGEEFVGGGIGPLATLGAKYSNIPSNIFYLTACLVDKMWQGTFLRDSHEVLDFIIKLLCQTKQKNFNVSLDPLFHSLNRTILFQLSRPMDNIQIMSSVLSCLQKVLTFQDLIFSPGNSETEFLGCLSYCLFQLTQEAHITMEASSRSTWHISMPLERNFSSLLNLEVDKADLVKETAGKVWTALFSAKRQQIEELYKISGSSGAGTASGSGSGTFYGPTSISRSQMSNVHMARMLFHESSSKIWTVFLESERKAGYGKELWQQHLLASSHTQLQSKLQKVTGGLTRLATRKIKKEAPVKPLLSNISLDKVAHWTQVHVAIVKDVVDLRAKHYQQTQQHLMKFVFEDWLQSESELTRERGLWGPPIGSSLDKWMLDMTEGPCRMRKKMVKNDLFFIHYPYRPEMDSGENRALKYKVANCLDSKEYYKRWRPETMVNQDSVCPESSGIVSECSDLIQQNELLSTDPNSEEREIGFQGIRTSSMLPLRTPSQSSINRTNSEWEELDLQETSVDGSGLSSSGLGSSSDEPQEDNPDSQSVLRLLEDGEKISHMFRCARIQGLDTCEGLLLFGKEHCYVVDGFTLLKTREIRDIDSLPANMHDPIIPSSGPRNKHQKKTCSKFAYEDIKEVHKRRYLLQPIALEVFSTDGRNHLLSFPKKIRNKVYARFLSVATGITDNVQDSLAGQKRGASVESSANLLSNLIGETSVTQRWVRGEISNFQYLMHLNTLAGRSYNDLMQYPVFPWVLADYHSQELDLNNPETFRDLSKPLGAQTPDRLMQFRKRYKEWDDPHGNNLTSETPPYHYGTFYSSAMIVASYLVRMEPFTQHFLRLQGGHFDLADRMFHSVGDAWMSASKHNMADIKELIPEFFYLPEFLLNKNRFDLGQKQNGVQLNDVVLPPWAKNDPREFIRVHRQALECDYVSSHLHEWIDLIFGFKQQGPAAVEAVNVFHHLFYEGNVDIYNIDDPLKKNATIGFINNFGQIPKQLFKKPHPVKKLTAANRVSGSSDPGPIMPGLSCNPDKLFFHNLDNLKPSMHPVKDVKGPVGQIIQIDKTLLAVEQNKVLVQPNYSRYLAWGFADHSLRIGAYESERPLFVWEETPAGEILCCAAPNEKTFITAGTNTMVTVWQFEKKKLCIKRNLYGHTEPVTCLTASRAYNLIVSGSRDHSCIIWDLSRLVFVRQLLGHPAPVASIAVNDLTGDIASCAGTFLFVWTINGDLIASINTAMGRSDRTQQILCVAFSTLNEWDNQNVIMTGASDGIVRMWSTDYVQVPKEKCGDWNDSSNDDSKNIKIKAVEGGGGETEAQIETEATREVVTKEDKSYTTSSLEVPNAEKRGEEIVRRMSLADSDLKRGELFDQSGPSSLLNSVCRKIGSESSLSEEEENLNASDLSLNKSLSRDTSNLKSPGSMSQKLLSLEDAKSPSSSGSYLLQHSKSIGGKLDSKLASKSPQQLQTVVRSSTLSSSERPTAIATTQQENALRVSKSETSLADSFVVVTESDALEACRQMNNSEKANADAKSNFGNKTVLEKRTKSPHQLRDGFVWQCQLVFRSKLTMHTAFDRKDNTDPAAVTAIAVSRDHKTVYVGDSKGRVFSWSVTDHPGRAVADHWVRDEGGDCCLSCGVRFSFSERRHHCRNCGQLFCSKCSRFESEIARLRIIKPVRVCQMCYNTLRASSSNRSYGFTSYEQSQVPPS